MRIKALFWTLMVAVLLGPQPSSSITDFAVRVIVKVVKENVAGRPVVHNYQPWHFHPDEGLVRRRQFEALHGFRAQNLIKSYGEGDGGFAKLNTDEGEHR